MILSEIYQMHDRLCAVVLDPERRNSYADSCRKFGYERADPAVFQ